MQDIVMNKILIISLISLCFSLVTQAAPKKKTLMSWPPQDDSSVVDISKFTTDPNLEVSLWAKSPMLFNPTNMDIDPLGRIWVTEGVNYREKLGIRRPAGDRIMVLIDTNGDGQADQSKVFLQDPYLESPLGIAVFDNRIVISQPPDVMVYTDVNRDLKFDPKVDTKEVLLTGFNGRQHDHSLHSITSGPDGKWYFNSGNCGAIFTDNSGKTFRMNTNYRGGASEKYFYTPTNELKGAKSDDGYVWSSGFSVRMNPDGTHAEIVGHGYRNSYEQVINSLGDMYQSDNDDYSSCRNAYVLEFGSAGYYSLDGQHKWQADKRLGQAIPRAHWRQDNPGTFDAGDVYGAGGPTGVTFYENGALGENWNGTYLSCEASRSTVFGYKPKPKGATYSLDRFDFLTSLADHQTSLTESDEEADKRIMFRPSDISVGPDGAIYVSDWFDPGSGGHATGDESASGAIYRIAPKGFKPKVQKLNLSTIDGQVQALKSPSPNVRHLGFNALKAEGSKAFPAVSKILEDKNRYVAARAIWLLPHLGNKGLKKTKSLIKHKNSMFRLVALRSLRRLEINTIPFAKILANDSEAGVRRDAALSLRPYPAKDILDIFVQLAKGFDGEDKNYLEAIGLGATNKENEVWTGLREKLGQNNPLQWNDSFAKITWRLWPSVAIDDLAKRVRSKHLSLAKRLFAVESIAFIKDPKAADTLFNLGKQTKDKTVKAGIVEWLLRKGLTDWSEYNIQARLKTAGIYDPESIKLIAISTPPQSSKSSISIEEVAKLKGNIEVGKQTIMRCVMCHEINGIGPNFGPRLKGWAKKQTKSATIKAILYPSQGIAHGFRGEEYLLKDGSIIHGITEVRGDPSIVLSQGGISQMIPKSRVQKTRGMKQSLMLSADQLALTAQEVADIVAFMKQWQ